MGLFTLSWLHLGSYDYKQTGTWLHICLVGFFGLSTSEIFSPKTGQKGLFGGFCLFICFFLKNHFIFLHLSEFCYSFIFPVTLVAQDYFLLDYCFLCNLSKTLDSPNKILKGEGAHGFHLL